MTLAVFFPSLMGVGILISGALLISDGLRRLFPKGSLRRKHNVVVGTYGAVGDAVDAAGYRLEEPWFVRRGLRTRIAYIIAAIVLVAAGILSALVGERFFDDPLGVFYESPWAIGLGYGFGTAFWLLALLCLTIAALYRSPPRLIMRLVNETSLGRIVLPTDADHRKAVHNIERET
ncbi:MAG: hypothetical protein GY788_25040 [bacterium]|nr:hypothetical protein [bacterium]